MEEDKNSTPVAPISKPAEGAPSSETKSSENMASLAEYGEVAKRGIGEYFGASTVLDFLWKEARKLHQGWILFSTLSILLCLLVGYIVHIVDQNSIDEEVKARQKAEIDRDGFKADSARFQTLYNSDENALAPLRKLADEKFALSPPDKRVDLLTQQLNEMNERLSQLGPPPRHLTNEQATKLTEALKAVPSNSHITLIYYSGDVEARVFAEQLSTIFTSSDFFTIPETVDPPKDSTHGILMQLRTRSHQPPVANVIIQELESFGFKVNVQFTPDEPESYDNIVTMFILPNYAEYEEQ